MRIAVLDSNRKQTEMISRELAKEAHLCRIVPDWRQLPGIMEEEDIDMVVIDACIGRASLLDMLSSLDDRVKKIPVLLLTNRKEQEAITVAFSAGAHDYLVKPLRRGEFMIRVQVLLARAYPDALESAPIRYGAYVFIPRTLRIERSGSAIEVTQKEFELALLFFRHLGRPLSRAYILEAIWSKEADIPSRTIDTHVSRVRSKLGLRPENGFRLAPVYSYGYRLEQLD